MHLSNFALQPSCGSHPYSGTSTEAQIPGAWLKNLLSFLVIVFLLLFAVCIAKNEHKRKKIIIIIYIYIFFCCKGLMY